MFVPFGHESDGRPLLPKREPLLIRVDRFAKAHTEVTISGPCYVPGRKWEVSEPDQPARAYDRGDAMMDDLEARYGRPSETVPTGDHSQSHSEPR